MKTLNQQKITSQTNTGFLNGFIRLYNETMDRK